MFRTNRRSTTLKVLVIAVLLSAAACSSSGGKNAGDTSNSSATAPAGPTSAPPTGEPIKIGLINDEGSAQGNTIELRLGAAATVKYLNKEAGGIKGRPVELVTCNGKNEPTSEQSCAQKFIDAKVVAVTGLSGLWGDNGVAAIKAQGIANVTLPVSATEFTCDVCFPLSGGGPAGTMTLASFVAKTQKAKSASSIVVDIPGAKISRDLFWDKTLKASGVTDVVDGNQPASAADFTPGVLQATSNNPDALWVVGNDQFCARVLKAAEQLGKKPTFYAPDSCTSPVVTDLPNAEGLHVYSAVHPPTDASDKDIALYQRVVKKYNGKDIPGFYGLDSMSQIMTLKSVIESLPSPEVSGPAVVSALNTVEGIPVFAGGKLSTANASKMFPHIKSPEMLVLEFKGGKFVVASKGFLRVLP